jgi:hypothetical protein
VPGSVIHVPGKGCISAATRKESEDERGRVGERAAGAMREAVQTGYRAGTMRV